MLLRKGDNNENVKLLQKKLHLDPVGNFGPKTEEAVKLWQAAHGLTADGIVGDKTWGMIMGEEEHEEVKQQVQAVANSTGLNLQKLNKYGSDYEGVNLSIVEKEQLSVLVSNFLSADFEKRNKMLEL